MTQLDLPTVSTRPVTSTRVDVYVDPICPFAWLTSRWVREVERVRPIDPTWRVMSLSVLNEGRPGLSDFYADLIGRGWGPARVAVAVELTHGSDGLVRFYEAFGARRHVGAEPLGDELLTAALAEAGLPVGLASAATTTRHDAALAASHERGMRPVGDDVGTPVLHVERHGATVTVFGPVVSPAPRGEAAGRMWDAVLELASTPEFFELKRSRRGPLDFS